MIISTKEKQKIQFIGERSFKNTPTIISKTQLDNNYALLKIYKEDILVTSWEGDNRGVIFKLDLQSNTFKKLINLKEIVQKNISLTDYQFINQDGADFLYFVNISDPKNIFIASKNKIIDKYSTNHAIQRVNFSKEGIFTTTWDSTISPQYFKSNLKNRITEPIPFNYSTKLNYAAILLDGIVVSDENYITITSYAQNIVLLFDRSFTFIRSLNLYIVNPEFKFNEISGRGPVINPNNIYPNIHADLYKKHLYVLTNDTGVFEDGYYYIDMYDLVTDEYISSYKFEFLAGETPKEIKILEDKIYILTNKSLYTYEKN
ncbi:hypothetical protein QNH98_13400 [Myroides sp. mNGS23_01]|nr:hypothetical protein [Myroides sp. mNGS23_01]WHT38073.1 hypothetical protein QNH98_13400 [Myroides sp. mNGS23_01]